MGNVAITTSDPSSTFCFRSFEQDWPYLVSLLDGNFEGNEINFGSTTPLAEDRDKPLFPTNADGTPRSAEWYSYSSGSWLARHPLPPGIIMLWDGAEANIPTLDGGEVATITASTGPMWEKVSAMNARFPIGPGTLPSGLVVPVGGSGGSEEVTLDLENIPLHDHGIPNKKLVHQVTPNGQLQQTAGNDFTTSTFRAEGGKTDGTTKPHNNIPPFYGIFAIKRTARLYYRL